VLLLKISDTFAAVDSSDTAMLRSAFHGSMGDVHANLSSGEAGSNQRLHTSVLEKYHSLDYADPSDVTTLMIRNVPRRYSEEALALELQAFMGPRSYNFLYLPWDTRRSSNVGFAFINFCSAPVAAKAFEMMNGARWRLLETNKVITVMAAHLQGLAMNLAHYSGTCVAEEGRLHAPIVLINGSRISFRDAVQQFCPPELLQKSKAIAAEQAGLNDESVGNNISAEGKLSTRSCSTTGGWSRSTEASSLPCDFHQQEHKVDSLVAPHAQCSPESHPVHSPSCTSQKIDVRKLEGYAEAWDKTNKQLADLRQMGLFGSTS